MSASEEPRGGLLIDAIDFQIPCRRFTIKANVTRDRQMPVVDEFVLRLLRVVHRISGSRLAGYFGFTAREMESVLLELLERGLVESDEEDIYLSPKGLDLFKGLTDSELPRLAAVESWTEGVWFDLISRNMMTPARFRQLPNLLALRDPPDKRQIPESFAREAFEQNFHDYARRVRHHPDADRLAIYSVSDVEAGIYGYQPMPADCVLDLGAKLESSLHLPFAEADPARFALLSLAATDAWAMLTGPEQSASGIDDYERLTGDARPRVLGTLDADAAAWSHGFAASDMDGEPLLFGATYLDHNIDKLCKKMEAVLGDRPSLKSSSVIWLRPGGTAWGRTFKVGEGLQRIRDILRTHGSSENHTVAIVPRAVPGNQRRNLKRVFETGRLTPASFYPSDLEIILVPGVVAMVALHMRAGRHGVAVGAVTSRERPLRQIERRLKDAIEKADTPLWATQAAEP